MQYRWHRDDRRRTCCTCATSTSSGIVHSVDARPPRSEAENFCDTVASFPKSRCSAWIAKKYRVDQSATRFAENSMLPFIRALAPSFFITARPTAADIRVVSARPILFRKTGSVITRVLSSSVGERTMPWNPPPIPPGARMSKRTSVEGGAGTTRGEEPFCAAARGEIQHDTHPQ